ncbi:MAG: c-type cytochrome [Rudanella sp.]|nr:c-type cytochrome [Rudanella sp.]
MSRLSGFCGALALSLTLLFNGGQVNGQDPTAAAGGGPAAATPAPASGGGDVVKGEALFKGNCAQCHAVTAEVLVGPGLQGVRLRTPGEAWLQKWIRNSSTLIATGDAYAVQVFNKFNKVQMPSYANLTDDDIKGILDYVDLANAPKTANVPTGGPTIGLGPAQSGEGGSPSGLFTFVLVALLVVMLLVLGVLLIIVTILSKAVQPSVAMLDGTSSKASLVNQLRTGLTNTANNPIIRSVVVWLFVLIVAKVVIDGSFSVGIQQGYAPKQPIQYSHKLHAGQYKIDCNYCHTGVNKGKSATIPAANICMNCHGVIKKESPEIQKIYAAIEQNRPIEWIRVHNLPDLAYFNHAQHVNVGNVQCQTCHGEIEKMEVVEQRSSLTMGWCIDCHRKTEVNTKDNAYYDKLVALHRKETKEPLKVANIGGLECSKCHY